MLFDQNPYESRITTKVIHARSDGVVLEDTIFYPTGGGQPGDIGSLALSDGRYIRIVDTRRTDTDNIFPIHILEEPIFIQDGTVVVAEINWERRYRHMRMHTCLHLLSAIVDAPVTGCSIAANKGRLDFDLPEPFFDKDGISARLQALVAQELPVITRWVKAVDIRNSPQWVRTRSVTPPVGDGKVRLIEIFGVDIQACGGTHVANTREIGIVKCVKIEKKSKHNRRIILEFE